MQFNRAGRGEALNNLYGKKLSNNINNEASADSNALPPTKNRPVSTGRGQLVTDKLTKSFMERFTNDVRNSTMVTAPGVGRGNLLARLKEKNSASYQELKETQNQSSSGSGQSLSSSLSSLSLSDKELNKKPVSKKGGTMESGEQNSTALISSSDSLPCTSSGSDEFVDNSSLSSEIDEKPPPIVMKGESGVTCTVVTNYIRLSVEPGKGIYQYYVTFEPDVDARSTRCGLVKQMENIVGAARSFDGRVLFLPHLLNDRVTEAKMKLHDGSVVTVSVHFVKQLHMGDHEAIMFYNMLFKRFMNILGLTLHGRNYYHSKGANVLAEHKIEIWPGYVTAIQEYEDGVMLCCDSSFRVLSTQTVYELMEDLQYACRHGDHGAPTSWQESLLNAVVGQKVLTRYNNKIYTVSDINFKSTPKDTFDTSNGKISYIDYYYRHYGITIKDAGQPLLVSEVKRKVRGQALTEFIDLIPELCYLSGLSEKQTNDHKLMKSLAISTKISPEKRKLALEKLILQLKSNEEVAKIFKEWGLSLANTSISLPSRILDPEAVIFGNGVIHPTDYSAEWGRAAGTNPVLHAVELKSWSVVSPRRSEQVVREFVKTCMQVSHKMGMYVSEPQSHWLSDQQIGSYVRTLRNLKQTQIVVVVIPQARSDKYTAIKKICCIDNPMPSQVILCRTLQRTNLRSIVQKIMLQINCKLGGALWQVKVPVKNTMVIGMDTYHDPKQKLGSVGALVSSVNSLITNWYSRIYIQDPKIELSNGLEISVISCLKQYEAINGSLPKQIIVYRDGLGDSQLETASKIEIPQFKHAFHKISNDYNPSFLFVVVQKRIATRILLDNGPSELTNPPAGTVLDHTVTRRNLHDFFLVSQSVTQGTVSPSHYIVIHNTTSMSPDQIQRFTNKMTYLYYNWCGTVCIPAPCLYAHKLAGMVGEHLRQEADLSLVDKPFYL